MAFVSVYLGLGSNQGNRLQNLTQALDLLDAAFGCHYTALSRIIETKAWGFKGDKFLNACVLYRIFKKGTPEEHGHEILAVCKDIERRLGSSAGSAGTTPPNTMPTAAACTTTARSTSTSFFTARSASTARTCRSRIRSSRSAIS